MKPFVLLCSINNYKQKSEIMTAQKFNPTKGKSYQVLNTKFKDGKGMMTSNSTHEFITSFPCYDARFHGVANPEDYICYKFKLPKQFGVVTFYQFQIKELIEA